MALGTRQLLRMALPCGLLLISSLGICAQQIQDQEPPSQGTPPDFAESGSPEPEAPAPPAFHSRFRFHAYTDIDYSRGNVSATPNHFSVDEIDLFGTATISPNLSGLIESVIDTSLANNLAVPVYIERMLLQYRASDYLTVEAGQYRTAIGYYSTAYLRGAWFQTAISRPRMFSFEEDGGILPLHNVGISASGLIPSGPLGLHYVVQAGNTQTWGMPKVDIGTGHNAINFSIFARPQAVPGLELGFSDYHDLVFLGVEGHRSGVTAHVVYTANRFEFLNEGVVASIRYDPANVSGTLTGFYSQLGYRFGPNWGPYVRIEKLSIHASPFLEAVVSSLNLAMWRSMYTGGVRYDWNEHVALKWELQHEADWGSPHYYQAVMQVAFAF